MGGQEQRQNLLEDVREAAMMVKLNGRLYALHPDA